MKKVETRIGPDGLPEFRLMIRKRGIVSPNMRPQASSPWVKSEGEALKYERRLLQSLELKIRKKETSGVTWGKLVQSWESALLYGKEGIRKITQNTALNYIQLLRDHTSHWNKLSVNEINQADVHDLYERIDQAGHSLSMQEKVRTAINSCFKWGLLTRKIKGATQSPTASVAMVGRKEEKLPEILTVLEIRQLLKMGMELGHPWYHIWAVALYTGMRNGELHALKWKSVNFENSEIYVHENYNTVTRSVGPTKSSYWRAVPMSPDLSALLKELKLQTGMQENVLPRFKDWDKGLQAKILRTFCSGIGIPSVKFHTLRACFATQLMRDAVAPSIVMTICGWKDLETMQIYIRRAGIEVKGATDSLKLLTKREAMGRIIELYNNK